MTGKVRRNQFASLNVFATGMVQSFDGNRSAAAATNVENG